MRGLIAGIAGAAAAVVVVLASPAESKTTVRRGNAPQIDRRFERLYERVRDAEERHDRIRKRREAGGAFNEDGSRRDWYEGDED